MTVEEMRTRVRKKLLSLIDKVLDEVDKED